VYLYYRNYSKRDPWYSLFLATFTSTQILDAYFWWLEANSNVPDTIPCTEGNRFVSKYIIGPVVFFQPVVLAMFPSDAFRPLRPLYLVLVAVGCTIPMVLCGCTTLWHHADEFTPKGDILYCGIYPPIWIVYAGIALWAIGAIAFIRPLIAGLDILVVGGTVLLLLHFIDGSIVLISKMCFYCLLLSVLWLLEPLNPCLPPGDQERANDFGGELSDGASSQNPSGNLVVHGSPTIMVQGTLAQTAFVYVPMQQFGKEC